MLQIAPVVNEKTQLELLTELTEKLRSRPKSKQASLARLVASGILTPKGNFTKPYSNLKKATAEASK
ncbi:MAG: hypothetical protein J0I41_08655 [Filimonas sp.]|nr:hypothetical protein [Filimonas sp.]